MNLSITSAIGHIRSFLSFVFITVNLLIWLPGLIMAALVRIILPTQPVKKTMFRVVSLIYKAAVNIDTWYLTQILKINLNIDAPEELLDELSRPGKSLVICNHQSWFDIFVLQALICRGSPILQFVIKRELLWVPVLGWVCLVLDFPRMQRKKDPQSRLLDRKTAKQASWNLNDEQGALMLFPEGTRSRDGDMGKGKTGVARLAAMTDAAVVPVAIRQTDDVWPVSKRAPRPWRKFYYKFGDPMYFDYKEETHDNFREFTDKIMSKISELSEECEEYWNSRKITNRLKNWKDKTRQRIASWRE